MLAALTIHEVTYYVLIDLNSGINIRSITSLISDDEISIPMLQLVQHAGHINYSHPKRARNIIPLQPSNSITFITFGFVPFDSKKSYLNMLLFQ